MKTIAILTIIFALALAISNADAADQPNIVFIMADDLGFGDLGCYGQKQIQTPHLDQMAAEGLRFTQAYAGCTVCAPSRSVLMTGQHMGHTRVRGNFGKNGVRGIGGGNGRVPLKAEDVTVAEVLKAAGYTTGMFGKWGLGEPRTTGEPNRQGFDTFFGYLNQRRAHSYYVDYLWHNTEKVELPGNKGGKRKQYTHDLITERALAFVRASSDKPFFCYIPYTIPHSKYEIPDIAPYADRPWKKNAKVHAAMVTRMDRDIGRLFALLKKLKIDEKTIVFFCSDNGAAERWTGVFDSSGNLKGRKRDMTEGGLRTPMIVRWLGQVKAGAVDNQTAWTFADVMPTLADLAGASKHVPKGIDGISVLPTLLGKRQDLSDRMLYWEFYERGFQQAGRWGWWKAIRAKPGDAIQLFDLKKDAGEKHNIAAGNPQVVARFETHFKQARTPSVSWPAPVD
jgi:arylsulfatase A-like enzyme